jgi:hypothetical protein
MADTAQRLDSAGIMDVPQALAVISEAVWWFTIVDATMIRYGLRIPVMPEEPHSGRLVAETIWSARSDTRTRPPMPDRGTASRDREPCRPPLPDPGYG